MKKNFKKQNKNFGKKKSTYLFLYTPAIIATMATTAIQIQKTSDI